jgi:hypothetical protein
LGTLYTDQEELEKIEMKRSSLEIEIQNWIVRYENDLAEHEKIFDDAEEEQENKLASMFILISTKLSFKHQIKINSFSSS